MEPPINISRNIYTRERLIDIRNRADLSRYPIPNSVISLDPEKRLPFRKTKPLADPAVLQVKSSKNTDLFFSGAIDISGGNGDTTPYSMGWQRTRRMSTGTPQSPSDTPSQRHYSGSSGGEDNYGGGNKSSGVHHEFDWALGCGKWRHRSTSGSEVGVHKSTFYVSGGRGRGRGRGAKNTEFHRQESGGDGFGGTFSGSSGARGRGFTHRPFQHSRGAGGFKPSTTFNNHGADHGPTIEDFEPQCKHDQHYQYPYPPHQGVPRQFHKDVGAGNASQRDETRWDHDTMSPAQPPQMPPPLSTKGYSAENALQPPLLPPSLLQTEQMAEVVPIMSESIAKTWANDSVTKPNKVHSFMSNTPSRPSVESQAQVAPPPQSPPQIARSSPTLWYYQDPGGNVRGPFGDSTMATWFSAGYLSVQIGVRRECDRVFSTITDYIAMLGRSPFAGSSDLPPILEHRSPAVLTSTLPLPPHLVSMVPQAPLLTPTPNLFPQQMNLLQSPKLQTSLAPPSTAPLVTALQPPQVSIMDVGVQPALVDPNQASKNVVDVNSLAQAALSEMVRLHRDAQCLCDRFSALGIDRSALAKSLGALGLGASETTTPPAPTPPNIINLQQLEETMHKRQQEEDEQLKRQQQQLQAAVEEISSLPLLPVQETEAPKVAKKHEKPSQPLPLPQKKQSSRKDNNVNLDQPPEPPVEKEPPILTATKKKRKKSKSVTITTSAEEVVGTEITTALTVTLAPGTPLEPEDDWIAVPSVEATFNAPVVQQQQEHQHRPTKKKKSKLTAGELRQQAWEQEEQRRRRANKERIAQMEAEEAAAAAAVAAEEAHLAAIASAKASAAEHRQKEDAELLLQRRKTREAVMRDATTKPACIGLPSTSCWGSASSNGDAAVTPSMTDIFALQMREEEYERTKATPTTTFASKVASGGLPSPAAAPAPTNKSKTAVASVKAPQKLLVPPKPNTSALNTSATVNVAQMGKTGVISIWDLPTNNCVTKSATSKNTNRKKKANASTHLIRGPIISLEPKARAELVRWCEGQLSGFPRRNVDIPTLISLVCDIEEAEDILECIESSFGKSQRVSKFSKAFVEKRANLMGTTV